MKNKKEVGLGVLITILLFVTSILIAVFIVKNKIPSNASNDGWLGFFGGLFGSFISGMITFYVLYIDRKGSSEQIFWGIVKINVFVVICIIAMLGATRILIINPLIKEKKKDKRG